MDIARIVFKAIDGITAYLENSKRYKGITAEKDIVYDDAHPRMKMDVRYQEGTKGVKKPVVVYIAGGGFVAGGKKYRTSITEFFASLGFCTICPDLRLAPGVHFPTPLFDLVKALNFIVSLKDEYNLDLDNVVITGDSAGGYFASYAVAITTHPTLASDLGLPKCDIKFSAFLGLCGVYDFVKMVNIPEPFGIAINTARDFAGYKFKRNFSNFSDYVYCDYISPINFVNENWCKSMLVYAEKDIFCHGQGELMSKKMDENGVVYEKSTSKHLLDNHCYFLFEFTKAAKKSLVDIKYFMKKIRDKTTN